MGILEALALALLRALLMVYMFHSMKPLDGGNEGWTLYVYSHISL